MPSTINGLLIFLVVLIPGVPGESVYSSFVGLDWREDQFQRVVRVTVISVTGLVLYVLFRSLVAPFLDLPAPLYVVPSALTGFISSTRLEEMAWAYLWHVGFSILLGVSLGWGLQKYAERGKSTVYPSAWDDLLRTHAPDHWIIVTLTDDTTYAGLIETVDGNVASEDRDLILAEPAAYDPDQDQYVTTPYQHLFLPAALITSIAVVYNPEVDKNRSTGINEPLFSSDTQDHAE